MASPKILIQIFVTGTRIIGKAFLEAGRQAVKNAKHSPQGVNPGKALGIDQATSGSITDQHTRLHRMTLEEAYLILNVKREDSLHQVLRNYDHLFKVNSPNQLQRKPSKGKTSTPLNSHYLQSKVVRARERIEVEINEAHCSSETSKTDC